MSNLQKLHVTSGSYHVGRKTPVLLQALLGSCVGVALFDEKAGVGGLVHLLLPEPVCEGSPCQPEKYASTMLPIFFRALYNRGASKKRLKAFIAGGALLGPIVSRDLQLDIGGRTAEIVIDYLKKEKIQIKKSETGGFFTCSLNLNLHNWHCSIEPLSLENGHNQTGTYVPTVHEIEQTMEEIQPIPQVALKILRLVNDEELDIKKLTEAIRQDQVLCAQTLKFCNSAVFAGITKIDSIDHALAFLGSRNLVKLIISTSVSNLYGCPDSGYSLCKGGLYHHAVGTAIISEKLANKTAKVKPGLAYTAGLLHDIGKVVLDQYIASVYPLFYRQLFEQGSDFSEAEKSILGVDHMEVGCDLGLRWSLPDTLVEAIRYHHQPENAVRHVELTHIVYLADLLMSRFHAGLELEQLGTEALSERLKSIGLSIERFSDIVDLIPAGMIQLN